MKSARHLRSSFKQIRLSFSLAAVVYLLLGLFMLLAPNTSRKLVCTLVGVGVLLYGLFSLVPFLANIEKAHDPLNLLIGVCALAFGVFSLINPTFLLDFLFTVLGVIVCITSAVGARRALTLRRFGYLRWWAPLASSLTTLALALCVVFFPGFFGDMLMRFAGLILLVSAVSDLTAIHCLSGYTMGRN